MDIMPVAAGSYISNFKLRLLSNATSFMQKDKDFSAEHAQEALTNSLYYAIMGSVIPKLSLDGRC